MHRRIRNEASRRTGRRLRPRATLVACLATGLALVVALLASSADARRQVVVYKAQFRLAEELLPLAETVMGSAGVATLDPETNALVLVGDAAAVAETLALLTTQDRAPRTVAIRHESMLKSELVARGFEIRWRVGHGDLRVGELRARVHGDASVDLRAEEAMRRLIGSFTSTVRVIEGAHTRIETGSSIPFAVEGRGGAGVEFVDASTGLEAGARILGDGRIRIDLASFAADSTGKNGSLDSTSASTQLVLEPGETLVVAGLDRSRDAARTERFGGARSETGRDETLWLLRVDVE